MTIRIVKKEDVVLDNAGREMRQIAEESGVRKKRRACIVMRRGIWRKQREGIRIINQTLREIGQETDRSQVLIKAGEATGYANAMENAGLMSAKELDSIIAVIGQAGEKAMHRIDDTERTFKNFIGDKLFMKHRGSRS